MAKRKYFQEWSMNISPKIAITIALIAIALFLNLLWINHNLVPPAWDQAGYESNAVLMGVSLNHFRLAQVWSVFVSHPLWAERPALVSLVGAVVYAVFPSLTIMTMATNVLFFVILMTYTFKISRQYISDPWTSYFVCFVVATMPAIAGTSREFAVDFPLTAMVSAGMYYWIRLNKQLSPPISMWLSFSISVALGMLVKETFPLYLFAPCSYLLVTLKHRDKRTFFKGLGIFFGVILVVDGPVYAHILPLAVHNAIANTVGALGNDYSRGFPRWSVDWGDWYLVQGISYGTSFIYAVIEVLLLFLTAIVHFHVEKNFKRAHWNTYGPIWLWILMPVVGLTLFVTDSSVRFVMPLLPAIAVAMGMQLDRLSDRWLIRNSLAGAAIMLGAVQFFAQSFGITQLPGQFAIPVPRRTSVVAFSQEPFADLNLGKPSNEVWPLNQIYETAEDQVAPGASIAIGVVPDFIHMNVNSFMLVNDVHGSQATVVGIGVGDPQPNYPSEIQQVDFVVGKTGNQGPSFSTLFASQINRDMKNLVHHREFSVLRTWVLPDGSTAILYERRYLVNSFFEWKGSLYERGRDHRVYKLIGYNIAHALRQRERSSPRVVDTYGVLRWSRLHSGSLVRFVGNSAVYWVHHTSLIPIPSAAVFEQRHFRWSQVVLEPGILVYPRYHIVASS